MQKIRKVCALLAALFLMAGLLSGCDTYDNFRKAFFEEPETAETVRIGIFEPLTGEEAANAADEVAGMELARELFPTVLGKPVEFVYADNQSSVEGAIAAAKELVGENVSVILGSYSSVLSMAGGDIFKEARIPAIAATCANPILTQTNDYYFRIGVVDAYQGSSAAYYVNNYLLQKTAAVLLRNGDEQAETMAEQFAGTLVALTGNESAVTKIYLPAEATEDYSVFLHLLAMTGQRAVFFPSSMTVGKEVILQENLDPDIDFSWVGTSQWDGIEVPASDQEPDPASYLNDVSYVINYDASAVLTDMSITLGEAYKERYGEDAEPSEAFAMGFDAYLLAADAIERAGDAGKGWYIAGRLFETKNFLGATGNITINSYGDPYKEITFERYMGGEFSAVYTAPPIADQK